MCRKWSKALDIVEAGNVGAKDWLLSIARDGKFPADFRLEDGGQISRCNFLPRPLGHRGWQSGGNGPQRDKPGAGLKPASGRLEMLGHCCRGESAPVILPGQDLRVVGVLHKVGWFSDGLI